MLNSLVGVPQDWETVYKKSPDLGKSKGRLPEVSFGRALTSTEKKQYKNLFEDAYNKLGIKNSATIVFDVSFPSNKKQDSGSGTSFSKDAQNFLGFIKDMLGFNTVQLGPQGGLAKGINSPYSGTVFSAGNHIIDLAKLTEENYGGILSRNTLNKIVDQNQNKNATHSVDYDFVMKSQEKALTEAYNKFNKLDDKHNLKVKFEGFKKDNESWLKADAIYEALSRKHNNDYWLNWNDDLDKNLFNDEVKNTETAKNRITDIEKDYKNVIDFHNFCQFVADEQQKESKGSAKELDVKLFGDCLIGFSPREVWANKSAFIPDNYLGCPDNDPGKNQYWGLPALAVSDDGKLNEPAKKLLEKKFDLFFKKYDGARIDAAWQLITPWIYEKDKSGNIKNEGKMPYIGDQILKIMLASAQKNNKEFDPGNIVLENSGGLSHKTGHALDNLFINDKKIELPQMVISQFGNENYARGANLSAKDYITIGTHDNESLISVANNGDIRGSQAGYLAYDLKLNSEELKSDPEKFRNAKFAELYTSKNLIMTIFDALGIGERFNNFNPDISEDEKKKNWTKRVPNNYEEFYHSQLTKGYGLNLAEALKTALETKSPGKFGDLTAKLDKAAKVLKEVGPLTTADADKKFGSSYSVLK